MSKTMLVLVLVVCATPAVRAGEEESAIPEFIMLSTMAKADAIPIPVQKHQGVAPPVTAPAPPECGSCQKSCAPCEHTCHKKRGSGFRKFLDWLTYRESGCATCCKSCQPYPCCTPPLYTFFLHRCQTGCSNRGCAPAVQYHQTNCCYQK